MPLAAPGLAVTSRTSYLSLRFQVDNLYNEEGSLSVPLKLEFPVYQGIRSLLWDVNQCPTSFTENVLLWERHKLRR